MWLPGFSCPFTVSFSLSLLTGPLAGTEKTLVAFLFLLEKGEEKESV